MLKRLLQRQAVQAALAGLIGRYLEFALATTRWRLDGAEHLAAATARGPTIAAFWHERLPLMSALWHRARASGPGGAAVVLVSRHRDGRLIGDIVRRFGVEIAYGSSARKGQDRGGAAGLLALRDALAAGRHAVITPDGPRGPRRQAAPGVAQLAALSGVAVLPCAGQTSRNWVLGTWDRMVLPLPFGRGVLVCGAPIRVARDGAEAALPAIQAAMTAAADRADSLCR